MEGLEVRPSEGWWCGAVGGEASKKGKEEGGARDRPAGKGRGADFDCFGMA